MKLPRWKIKLNSLTECGTGRKNRDYETSEMENKIKFLDRVKYRKEKLRFFIKLPRGKIKLNSLTICGTGRKNRDSL